MSLVIYLMVQEEFSGVEIGNVFPWWGDRTIQYVTTATLGNSSTFGQPLYYATGTDSFNRTLYYTTYKVQGTSDGIYGLQWGGYRANSGNTTSIEYITIDTTGNAQQFGYYGTATSSNSAWNDATRSVMYHGSDADYYSVYIKYLTTQTIECNRNFQHSSTWRIPCILF